MKHFFKEKNSNINSARLLKRSLNATAVKTQDVFTVISSVSANAVGRETAFKHIDENWKTLNAR